MQLVHEFVVTGPIEQAWAVLTDIERVVPCMPGAQLTGVDGDTYHGTVRVKVGPMLAQFAGQARFRELDAAAHRAVLEGRGKDRGGRGQASVLVTADLTEQDPGTKVDLTIDLTISGRLAQFGQGAMAEISNKLLGQFVECLERNALAEPAPAPAQTSVQVPETAAEPAEPGPEPATPAAERSGLRTISGPEAEPVDLLRSAGVPVLKRLVPVLLLVAAVVVVLLIVLLA